MLLALAALHLVWITDFLHGIQHIQETTDKEGSLKARDSIVGQRGSISAVGAFHSLSLSCLLHQWLEAVLTEDVEAV